MGKGEPGKAHLNKLSEIPMYQGTAYSSQLLIYDQPGPQIEMHVSYLLPFELHG